MISYIYIYISASTSISTSVSTSTSVSISYIHIYIYISISITARALYKNVGRRWPGSLNFLTERVHVFQYVCVFNQSKVPQFLSHARGCLFVFPEPELFFCASPCSCAHQFLRTHPNLRLEDSRVPEFLNSHFHFHIHKTSGNKSSP